MAVTAVKYTYKRAALSKAAISSYVVGFFCLVALHSDVGLASGGARLPSVLAIALLFVLAKYARPTTSLLIFWVVLAVATLLSYITSDSSQPDQKLYSSTAQMAFCAYFSLILFRWAVNVNYEQLRVAISKGLIFYVALVILEWGGVLTGISNSFGEYFYSGDVGFTYYGLNEYAIARDQGLSGWRRPTVFSPEPSIAALTFSVLCIAYALIHRHKRARLVSYSLLLFAWYIFNSPTPVIAILVIAVINFSETKSPTRKFLASLMLVIAALAISPLIAERISRITTEAGGLETTSEGIRIALPIINAVGNFFHGNFFGASPGAQFDPDLVSKLNPLSSPVFGTNGFALLLFYFGPFVMPLLIFLYWRIFRRSRYFPAEMSWVNPAIIALFLSFSLGSYESVRLLGYWALLTACLIVRNLKKNDQR